MTNYDEATTEQLGWKVDFQKQFPVARLTNITVVEKTLDNPESLKTHVWWEATYNGCPDDGSTAFKLYGPRVTLTRRGTGAREAVESLTAALEEQGWIVK